jgi:N-carbamoylputrescine amidase
MYPTATKIRVAAIQMISRDGLIHANLARATEFVKQAAQQGAQLALLPELLPTGYRLTQALWEAAEPRNGLTLRWLKAHSQRFGMWLGTSFLEAEGQDFFNTFVLTSASGEEAIRVRKYRPAVVEAYFYTGASGPHAVDSPLGRIGISICYESSLCHIVRMLHAQAVDLILMPHSAPTPTRGLFFSAKDLVNFHRSLQGRAQWLARTLGVPTVLANKAGPWKSPLPLPYPTQDSSFPGFSTIVDSDGTCKVQLGNEEGVIVADVVLDPARKVTSPPPCYGRWSHRPYWYSRLWVVIEGLGSLAYGVSLARRRRARQIGG